MKKCKINNGITLIALVVTIIILLILAGVTIGMATNGTGLFEKAKEATEKYHNAQEDEQIVLNNLINEMDINSYRTSDSERISNLEAEVARLQAELNSKQLKFVGMYVTGDDKIKLNQDISLTIPNIESGNYAMVAFRTGGWFETKNGVSICNSFAGTWDINSITGGTIEKLGDATYKLAVESKADISITFGAQNIGGADQVNTFIYVYLMKY